MTAYKKIDPARDGYVPTELKLSALVRRLISAREDAAKSKIHRYLTQQTNEQLRESLGFSDDDIGALRAGQFRLPWAHRSSE